MANSILEPRVLLETVQWTALKQIEDLRPINDDDYAVLEELRQVLLRHGYQDRFGVCLLHKHFDLNPGEAALEESDEAARISTIRVVPEDVARAAMETAWRFSADIDIKAGRKCDVTCKGDGSPTHIRKHSCD
jgi:hypothetical protein